MLSLAHIPTTEGEAGRGELNNAATWDDFPNGRFGDFKSPAFGDQGPWGTPGISVRLSVFLPSGYQRLTMRILSSEMKLSVNGATPELSMT
jgi:hypothetical protein